MEALEQYVLVDPEMKRVHERVASVAAGGISVLVLGETGTGKEIIAETIHRLSPRRDRTFLRLNCAALSDSLVTSELFGHERGAFTGAAQAKRGLLAAADGGTVFLDEIAEMPLSLQIRLLRVIEDRQVTPVGGLSARSIDIRLVSATNRSLEQEIDRGTFRQDFYYRLNGVTVTVPPLRDRRSEIEPLALYFVARTARDLGRPSVPVIAPEALEWMLAYRWPGNVRELRNAMERGVLLCRDDRLTVNDVHPESLNGGENGSSTPAVTRMLDRFQLREVIGSGADRARGGREGAHQAAISEAMELCGGNQTRAAKLLQISRSTLVSRLTEYGFPRPRKGGNQE